MPARARAARATTMDSTRIWSFSSRRIFPRSGSFSRRYTAPVISLRLLMGMA